jgi:hypothetical protein
MTIPQVNVQHKGVALAPCRPDHIGRTRDALVAQEISFRLGMPLDAITPDLRWEFAVGSMEDGASEHWPRWPYRFPWPPPEPDWPQPSIDLITEMEA